MTGNTMAEIEHLLLDSFQLEEIAEKMSVQTKKFSKIQHKDPWKLLLGLYREEVINFKGDSWPGIQASNLAGLVSVTSNERRHLTNLKKLGLVTTHQHLYKSAREVYYSLTTEGRLFVEESIQKTEDMIKFVSADVVAGEIPRISAVLDRYNILVGALAFLHNYPEESEEAPDLYDLSQTLDLYPHQIIKIISNYLVFNDNLPKKDTTPFFRIYPSKPRFKRFAFNCNDWVICNYLCHLCHETVLELTPVGEDMCKSLSKTPQSMNFRIRQTSIVKFFTFSLITSFFILSFATMVNESLLDASIYFLIFIFAVNSIIYWFLSNKNSQLLFGSEEED